METLMVRTSSARSPDWILSKQGLKTVFSSQHARPDLQARSTLAVFLLDLPPSNDGATHHGSSQAFGSNGRSSFEAPTDSTPSSRRTLPTPRSRLPKILPR